MNIQENVPKGPDHQPNRAEADALLTKLIEARISIQALRESFGDDIEKNKEIKFQYNATRNDTDNIRTKLNELGYTENNGVIYSRFV